MQRICATLLLLAASTVASADTGAWNFRVLLDGREIGRHAFSLQGAEDSRELRSEASFDVKLLFINAWRYRHQAVERWDGDCLQSMDASTEANGKRQTVRASRRDGSLRVEHKAGDDRHDGCVMSFAYWNPRILDATALLNAQNGLLVPVRITDEGRETVMLRGQPVTANRHRISGRDVQIDLWYANERWIALEAQATGDRRLRYELL